MLSDFPLLVKPGLPHLPHNRARLCECRSGRERGGPCLSPRREAARCGGPAVLPQCAPDRQLEISRLLPATNGEIFFPPLLFIALQREKKGNFSRFQNKQGQSTDREGGEERKQFRSL